MKSSCVKQKKETECTQPSGYKTAKNGRAMFWCNCAECGIKKTRFVSNTSGKGLLLGKNSPFKAIPILRDII